MKAIFLTASELGPNQIEIEGPRYHHLIQVTRAKVDDEILLLDGKGHKAIATITEIKKKTLSLIVHSSKTLPNEHFLSAFIGCPKKEAVEEILRRAVELGLKEIIFYKADYSPWIYAPHARLDKIIESALIQSNNFWAPEITVCSNLEESLAHLSRFKHGLLLDLNSRAAQVQSMAIDLLCIGPEGGWSSAELRAFGALSQLEFLKLQTPILRAEHALSVAAGYALAKA